MLSEMGSFLCCVFLKVVHVATDPSDPEELTICEATHTVLGMCRVIWQIGVLICWFRIQIGYKVVIHLGYGDIEKAQSDSSDFRTECDTFTCAIEVCDEFI